jgi:hypothetical protein
MTNEDLLRTANEADLFIGGMEGMVALRKFAALVAKATAEDCAKVCDAQRPKLKNSAKECAVVIRTKYELQ